MKNLEQNEVRERFLSVDAVSYVLQCDIQRYKDQDTQNYNCACCLKWVCNVSVTLKEEHRQMVFENVVLG